MSAARLAVVVLVFVPGLALAGAKKDVPHPERLRGVDPAALTTVYSPGAFAPEYEPPAPGSYTLPVVDTVDDHPLLDAAGRRTTLFAQKRDRLAVVAFVYTTCIESTGCPLSMGVLHQVDRALAADPELGRTVTLLTISFDPERDTPARMNVMRGFHSPRSDWRFLTTSGPAELGPLLADFDQPVAKLRYPDGQWSGLYRHVLKVFLLDRTNHVRNVYSAGFLNPRLVLNDLKTVLGADRSVSSGSRPGSVP